jgi:hypothetical protein
MYAVPLPASKTGMISLILFRPDTMGWWDHASDDLGQETTHGFVVASFTVADLPAPVTFAAGHLDPYSGDKALYEAKLIATRAYRYGPYAVTGVPASSFPSMSGLGDHEARASPRPAVPQIGETVQSPVCRTDHEAIRQPAGRGRADSRWSGAQLPHLHETPERMPRLCRDCLGLDETGHSSWLRSRIPAGRCIRRSRHSMR